MVNKKRTYFIIGYFVAIFVLLLVTNHYFPYIRTDIFRTFAKGNWYITSESDTLYTMGYYGVRQYKFYDSGQLKLLKENDEICHDRLIGRGGSVYKDYVYVTQRSFLTGKTVIGDYKGQISILKKKDLSLIKEIKSDIKLVEGRIIDHYLVVTGLGGFDIFDLDCPLLCKKIFEYRHPTYREYHGFSFMTDGDKQYLCIALFAAGIDIWDITDINTPVKVLDIPLRNFSINGKVLPQRCQILQVWSEYPYIYAPLGVTQKKLDQKQDELGLLVFDVSNFDTIRGYSSFIEPIFWYKMTTGDMQPTYIQKLNNTVYLNFGELGVAVFDVRNPTHPSLVSIDRIEDNGLIQPIHISSDSTLFAGSYYFRKIFHKKIKAN